MMKIQITFAKLIAMVLASAAFVTPSQAAVTAYLSAGSTCNPAATSANFITSGASVNVSLCINATLGDKICSATYRFVDPSATSMVGHFTLTARAMAPAYNFSNLGTFAVPFDILNPASTATNTADYGAGTPANLPGPTGNDQLFATLTLAPQGNAFSSSYSINLDTSGGSPFSVAAIDQDANCGGVGAFPYR